MLPWFLHFHREVIFVQGYHFTDNIYLYAFQCHKGYRRGDHNQDKKPCKCPKVNEKLWIWIEGIFSPKLFTCVLSSPEDVSELSVVLRLNYSIDMYTSLGMRKYSGVVCYKIFNKYSKGVSIPTLQCLIRCFELSGYICGSSVIICHLSIVLLNKIR